MRIIQKAIIPAAGLGTRFLPATKIIPKELFPIIDTPVIQLIVEELIKSKILQVILVINKNKEAIKRYFLPNRRLENFLKKRGKANLLSQIKKIEELVNFDFVYQPQPKGNGDAILCAEKKVKNEPFVVNWADDLIIGKKEPYFTQLTEVFKKYQGFILSVVKTDAEGQKRYGIIKPKKVAPRVYRVLSVVEKPGPKKAPSNLAHVGGFILTPKIFKYLKNLRPGKGGEIWLQDAINLACLKEPVYAYEFDGDYLDVGERLGYLKSIIKMALRRNEIKEPFKNFLKDLKI